MMLRKILACALALSCVPSALCVKSEKEELFKGEYGIEDLKKGESLTLEQEVPDGDYIVTVTTGGSTETKANIYINGGERVRAYTLEAGEVQKNEQPVVPADGKITIEVKGDNPNVTGITVEQLPARTEKGEKPTLYIAGDSTAQTYNYEKVYPQTGWGQVFGNYFTDDIVVENRSMGGRSSKSYNNDGRLDRILTEMHPGDYVFIQFGINDGNVNKPERYISVEDYKKLITDKYIGEVKKRGGIPVLLTATAASWWDEEKNCYSESRQDYAVPTKEIAKETGTQLIDINDIMYKRWNELGKEAVEKMYFICEPLESKAYPTGTDDHTHLKAAGAEYIAQMIADVVKTSDMEIAAYIRPAADFKDIEGHWAENDIKTLQKSGCVDGVSDTAFEPDSKVTRAEFLKMAMEACNIPGHAYREEECIGASKDDWYRFYLQSALDKGLIPVGMGMTRKSVYTKVLAEASEDKPEVTEDIYKYEPGSASGDPFSGNKEITREEMAAIAMSCVSYMMKQNEDIVFKTRSDDSVFSDADQISEIYRNAVDAAYSYGIINGSAGSFAPKSTLTRAEAATVVTNIINEGVIR